MTYHRATDPVVTPDGPAIYWQTWPDEDMGKVQLAKGSRWPGRFRSYRLDQIKPAVEVSEVAAVIVATVAAAFKRIDEAIEERRETWRA